MIPCYNGHKISGSQQYFLDRDAIWVNKQLKKSLGYCRFVLKWNHVQESLTCQFFFCHICRTMVCWDANFATKGQGGYLSVTFFVELIFGRGSYIQCMKRLRKGENICVLFENPSSLKYWNLMNIIWISCIGTARWRNKCREDHGSYRCTLCSCKKQSLKNIFQAFFSQSRSFVFNCNDLLCIKSGRNFASAFFQCAR